MRKIYLITFCFCLTLMAKISLAKAIALTAEEVCSAVRGTKNQSERRQALRALVQSRTGSRANVSAEKSVDHATMARLKTAESMDYVSQENCVDRLSREEMLDQNKSSSLPSATIGSIEVAANMRTTPPPREEPIPVVSGCAVSVTLGGSRKDCDDFFSSVISNSSNPSSVDSLTGLMSKFIIDDNIIYSDGDEKFCNDCFKRKFKTFKDLYEDDETNSTWVTEILDDRVLASREFDGLKEKARSKITDRLAIKSAKQNVFKLSNIIQQFEHMKFLYNFPADMKTSCMSVADLESKITNSCNDKDLGNEKIKQRIKNAFGDINQDLGADAISLEKNFDALIEKINVSDKACENNQEITRQDFLSYEYDIYSRFGLKSVVTSLIDTIDPEATLNNKQGEKYPSDAVSKAIVEDLFNGTGKVNELFSSTDSTANGFSPEAQQYLQEQLNLSIPFDKDEFLKSCKCDQSVARRQLVSNIGFLLGRAASLEPAINSVFQDWDSFKKVSDEYNSRTGQSFGSYIFEGASDSSISDEMQKRYALVYEEQCKSIQESLAQSICTTPDDLANYSHDDIEIVAKELNYELSENDMLTKSLGSLAFGSVSCNEKNSEHTDDHKIISLKDDIYFYSQSDVFKEATSRTDDGTVGHLDTFAASGHSCNETAKRIDRARFECFYGQSCEAHINLSQEDVTEYTEQPAVSNSSYRSTEGAAREAIEAINNGKSTEEVEEEFYKQKASESNKSSNKNSSKTDQKNAIRLAENTIDVDTVDTEDPDESLSFDSSLEPDEPEESQELDNISDMLAESMNIFNPSENDYTMPYSPYSSEVDESQRVSEIPSNLSEAQDQALKRAALIGELSDRFTPGELERMSLDQLRALAGQRDQLQEMQVSELEDQKKQLEQEIAELEKTKLETELERIREEREKLAQEKARFAAQRQEQGLPESTLSSSPLFSAGGNGRSVASIPTSIADVPSSTAETATYNTDVSGSASGPIPPQISSDRLGPVGALSQRATKGLVLTSKIPSDLSSSNPQELGPTIQDYLQQADAKNLLLNKEFVKFEKEDDKLVAIYVQNEAGELVRVELSLLDESTKELVDKYQKLSESEILAQEQSVNQKMLKLEEQMLKAEAEKASRGATLELLNAQLMLYDQEIKARE